jgi:hypothetical protein
VEAATRLSSQVPFGAVNFGADLPLNGQNILNVGYMTLVNTLATPGASPVNRITAFAGDLWYVSPSGAIQLTTGATLNAAALGGITGDYGGASPAQFRYDSVTSKYSAFSNFGTNTLGFVRAAGFDVAASSSVFARILFAGGSNQTYTLPSATPASTRPLFMTSAGAINTGNTQSMVYNFSPVGGTYRNTAPSNSVHTLGGMLITNSDFFYKGLDGLPVGFQIVSLVLGIVSAGIATDFTVNLIKVDAAGTITTIGTATQASFTSRTNLTMTLGTPETMATNASYFLQATGTAATNRLWQSIQVTGNQTF